VRSVTGVYETMIETQRLNYARIAAAIDAIAGGFHEQPSLEELATVAGLSPTYFQRLFTDWAGVSPKQFTRFLTVEYAKSILSTEGATVLDTAYETGLSGAGRLHDLFVTIEGMTPGEFRSGGADLRIDYSTSATPFGPVFVASTSKGVCQMTFDDKAKALADLEQQFPNAQRRESSDALQRSALGIFTQDWSRLDQIRLHLRGTPFQLKVWSSLLRIPVGRLTSYGAIAAAIGRPRAARAVGMAIASNPIAFLIPCHRVIRATGRFGHYRWGATRKQAMIGWEASRALS
jgi:AraC family transcriptional regulator of adaptative response/methylated-DNA-[protein]-cysteine methyltransferase